jgi:HAD superfamily hydrolase (TIGR01549 family)
MSRTAPPRPTAAVRAVLFDMDDTIFDHSRTAWLALGRLRSEVPALQARPIGEVARRYGELLDEIYPSVLAGHTTHEAARIGRFSRLLAWAGRKVDRREAEAMSDEYRRQYQTLRRPVPGAPQMLRELHGKATLGIVSNNHQAEQIDKLRAIGLEDRFDFVLTSERAGFAKPDPRIFEAAVAEAHVRPSQAVMVGDSWKMDVLGAKAAGVAPLWFNRWKRAAPPRSTVREIRSWSPSQRVAAELLRAPSPLRGTRRGRRLARPND